MELEKSPNYSKRILLDLMKSLYYPAILGTWLFLYVSKVIEIYTSGHGVIGVLSKIEFWFGLYLLIYYSMTFWDTYSENDSNYKPENFFLDVVEVIFICLSFYFLGFFARDGLTVKFPNFYFSLIFLPWLHPFWAWRLGYRRCPIPSTTQFLRFILYLLGIFISERLGWYNTVLIILLFGNFLLGFYEMSKGISINFLWDRFLFPTDYKNEPIKFGISKTIFPILRAE